MSQAILHSLLGISDALEAAGVPPLSPYWRKECERFYRHPTARLLVESVGRGGDKSRTSVMMSIAEVLAGEHKVAPGERHFFTHISENVPEASKTLGVLENYLRILGVPFIRVGDTIELAEMPRGWKVLSSRVGAVSGWRCLGWTADENAKWDNDGADPSAEVVASIKAMTVTHPNARGRMISSPVARAGHFYETWVTGNTDEQLVGHAPTWIANPSVTEEQTHKLERNPKVWEREYEAHASESSDESLLTAFLVDRAMRPEPGDVAPQERISYTAAMDPSLGRNAWTFCIAGALYGGKASIVLHREWRAPKNGTLDPAAVLASTAAYCQHYRVTDVRTDQFHGEALKAICDRLGYGIDVVVDKPTAAERLRRYEGLATRFLDDAVELPRDTTVRSDLLAIRRRLSGNTNAFTITMSVSSDGRHADYAPSIALALERVATEDAQPIWASPDFMQGAAQCFGFNHDGSFGQRDKKIPPLTVTTDAFANAFLVRGNPPHFAKEMTAQWAGVGPIMWSRQCTDEFKEAVLQWRRENL